MCFLVNCKGVHSMYSLYNVGLFAVIIKTHYFNYYIIQIKTTRYIVRQIA